MLVAVVLGKPQSHRERLTAGRPGPQLRRNGACPPRRREQLLAQPVDEDHHGADRAAGSGQRRPRPRTGHPERRGHGRQDVGQARAPLDHRRPVSRRGRGRGQRAGEGHRGADGVGALGVGGQPQRDVVGGRGAGVPVVGLAVRVGAAGRLEVDPGERAPADGQGQLARASRRRGAARGWSPRASAPPSGPAAAATASVEADAYGSRAQRVRLVVVGVRHHQPGRRQRRAP